MPSHNNLTTDDITSRTSGGRRMYGCPFESCPYEHRVKRTVERHMESHQGSHTAEPTGAQRSSQASTTTFQCPDCPLDFPILSRLRKHQLSHTDERPFECAFCPFQTKSKTNKDRHQERHVLHAWPCFHCCYDGASWDDVASHMQTTHRNRKEVLERKRQKVVKRTLENRELVAAGIIPKRQMHRRSASRAGSALLSAAAANAAASVNPVPEAHTAITTGGQSLTRFQPCGIYGHVYTDVPDFQLHDCEVFDELDESWENQFHDDADL